MDCTFSLFPPPQLHQHLRLQLQHVYRYSPAGLAAGWLSHQHTYWPSPVEGDPLQQQYSPLYDDILHFTVALAALRAVLNIFANVLRLSDLTPEQSDAIFAVLHRIYPPPLSRQSTAVTAHPASTYSLSNSSRQSHTTTNTQSRDAYRSGLPSFDGDGAAYDGDAA